MNVFKLYLTHLFVFIIGPCLVSGQNVINHPSVEKGIQSSDFEVKITKVDNTKDFTAVYMEVKNLIYYSSTISFDPTNRYKLVDVATGNSYKLLNDMPSKENAVKIRARESFVFYLKFEKIPKEVLKVNMMQGNRANGWHIFGIDTDFERHHIEVGQKKTFTGIVFNEDFSSVGLIQINLSKGEYSVKMFKSTDVYLKTEKRHFFKNMTDNWAISIFNYTEQDDKLVDIEGTIYSNNYGYSPRYWFVGFEGNKNQLLQKKSAILKLVKQNSLGLNYIEMAAYSGVNKYIKKGTPYLKIRSKKVDGDFEKAISFINYDFGKHSYSIQGLTKVIGKTRESEYFGPVVVYKLNRYGDEPATPYYYIGEYNNMFFTDGTVRSYNLKNEQTEECVCKSEVLNCKQLISTIAQKKFAEFLGASTIVGAGTAKLIELAASAGSGSSLTSNSVQKETTIEKSWNIQYFSKATRVEVEHKNVDKKYVTVSIISDGDANDKESYFSSVTIKDKWDKEIRKIECKDPFEDNDARNKYNLIKFNPAAGEYAIVNVAYGHKDYKYFGKDGYLGIGTTIRLDSNAGDYEIKVNAKK